MDKKELRSVNDYPITTFTRVVLGDVDNVNYFADNIDASIKEVAYRDKNGLFIKKEIFSYELVGGSADNVKRIYASTNELFLGVWGTSVTPPDATEGSFYYATDSITVDGIAYVENEILGYIDIGYGELRWRKGQINSNDKVSEV